MPSLPSREIRASVIMIGAGGLLALAPVTFQAVAARVLPLETQALVAVALGVGAYLGQITGAWVVEARLAAGMRSCIPYPRLLLVSSAAAAVVILARPNSTVALVLGLPLLIASMSVGRLISVAEQRHAREVIASMALLTGVVVAAALSFRGDWSLRAVTIGCATSGAVRFVYCRAAAVPLHQRVWVSGETALTGFAQPALNAVLLILAGPQAAIAFRAVATVSGALEPVLAYTRIRLLVQASSRQVWTGAVALTSVLILLSIAEVTGVFRAYLGAAWANAGPAVLLTACFWRASSLITTVPFTTLRRQGRTRSVFWLRAGSSMWSFLAAAPVAVTGNPVLIFAALLVAETTSSIAYFVFLRRYPDGGGPTRVTPAGAV